MHLDNKIRKNSWTAWKNAHREVTKKPPKVEGTARKSTTFSGCMEFVKSQTTSPSNILPTSDAYSPWLLQLGAGAAWTGMKSSVQYCAVPLSLKPEGEQTLWLFRPSTVLVQRHTFLKVAFIMRLGNVLDIYRKRLRKCSQFPALCSLTLIFAVHSELSEMKGCPFLSHCTQCLSGSLDRFPLFCHYCAMVLMM